MGIRWIFHEYQYVQIGILSYRELAGNGILSRGNTDSSFHSFIITFSNDKRRSIIQLLLA